MLQGPEESGLQSWIETSLKNNSHTLAAGYQGKTLEYRDDNYHLVIKVPHGTGLIKYLHSLMLRHEYRVYQQLEGLEAFPRCYGMVANKYLVLEYIHAKPIRERRPQDPEKFFATLLDQIRTLHASHVAHMDLKKKDNLLVTDADLPCIIDFGAAVIYKKGLHPFNHFRYRLGTRFDLNSWVKHKYHDNMDNISETDNRLFRRTLIERAAKRIKLVFHSITQIFH